VDTIVDPDSYTEAIMREITPASTRRGITVLGLLLLIIALMVAGFFLVRYLRSRQTATRPVSVMLSGANDDIKA
jgi:hypothetical protein